MHAHSYMIWWCHPTAPSSITAHVTISLKPSSIIHTVIGCSLNSPIDFLTTTSLFYNISPEIQKQPCGHILLESVNSQMITFMKRFELLCRMFLFWTCVSWTDPAEWITRRVKDGSERNSSSSLFPECDVYLQSFPKENRHEETPF